MNDCKFALTKTDARAQHIDSKDKGRRGVLCIDLMFKCILACFVWFQSDVGEGKENSEKHENIVIFLF